MPGTVKSELLPDADRSHKCDCQEKVSWKRNLPLDKSHFITETKEWRKKQGQKYKGSHVDWWLYEDAEPWIEFKEVTESEC